jgi:hypothetical protein
MRPARILLIAMLAVLPFLAGCSSNNKGKIEGTSWTSTQTNIKGASVPAGHAQLTFHANGKLFYYVGDNTYSGSYSLGIGDTVILNFDQNVVGRKTHHQRIVINGKKLTLIDSDGTTVVFEKKI